MMNDLLVLALGWLLVLLAILGFLSLRRYLEHRERMAMIARGITPPEERRNALPQVLLVRRPGVLQGGLITAMVGLALTLGLYPIGFYVPQSLAGPYHIGPWLLAGLIPLAVGCALVLGHYLTPGRLVELPPVIKADYAEGLPQSEEAGGRLSSTHGGRSEPTGAPESGHWTLYRRASGPVAEPAHSDEDDPNTGMLPRANA